MNQAMKSLLERQQYRFVGRHSAVKICHWTKRSLTDCDTCYKETFYGINAHRCVQMSPSVGFCQNNCIYCWRETQYSLKNMFEQFNAVDEPSSIVDNCISAQRKLLAGFGGNALANKKKYTEAQEPIHFAISLSGEPTMYPKLGELIAEINGRGHTSFLVTNGMLPERLAELENKGQLPTQLYLSLNSTTKEQFEMIAHPLQMDPWERLQKSMALLRRFRGRTRTTVRITLIKGYNMQDAEGWASMLMQYTPQFVEVKAYMFVGSSRERLTLENMPSHTEVKEFARQISEHCCYRIIDEKPESRVVLLMEQDSPERLLKPFDTP